MKKRNRKLSNGKNKHNNIDRFKKNNFEEKLFKENENTVYENNLIEENCNTTQYLDSEELKKDPQVEQILDFYKDIPLVEKSNISNDDIKDLEIVSDDTPFSFFFRKLKPAQKSFTISSGNEEEIKDVQYGLSNKSKTALKYGITLLLCAVIIGSSYGLSLLIPSNDNSTEIYADELRAADDYKTLKQEYSNVSVETTKIRDIVSEKKNEASKVNDADNTQADLMSQIQKKSDELDAINSEIADKRQKITVLESEIAQYNIPLTLSPGRYVVGSGSLVAGKYTVSGTGSIAIAAEDKVSKLNKTLSSTSIEIELQKGDIVKITSSVKFSPVI